MRLILDEMLDRAIAEQLRGRGWDVEAIQENPDLRGVADESLLELLLVSKQALVTDNVVDFAPLHTDFLANGRHHAGLVFGKIQRSKATIGIWVTAIDGLLTRLESKSDLGDDCVWL